MLRRRRRRARSFVGVVLVKQLEIYGGGKHVLFVSFRIAYFS